MNGSVSALPGYRITAGHCSDTEVDTQKRVARDMGKALRYVLFAQLALLLVAVLLPCHPFATGHGWMLYGGVVLIIGYFCLMGAGVYALRYNIRWFSDRHQLYHGVIHDWN